MYSLTYNGEQLAEWTIPRGWLPSFGTLLAVKYHGRLTLFRAMGIQEREILLDIYQS
jgi:hypothetical protein